MNILVHDIYIQGFFNLRVNAACVICIACGKENFGDVVEAVGFELLRQPFFIFAGMAEVFFHNMAVNDNVCGQRLLFRIHVVVVGSGGAVFGIGKET